VFVGGADGLTIVPNRLDQKQGKNICRVKTRKVQNEE